MFTSDLSPQEAGGAAQAKRSAVDVGLEAEIWTAAQARPLTALAQPRLWPVLWLLPAKNGHDTGLYGDSKRGGKDAGKMIEAEAL